MHDAAISQARTVRLLATGGTISMQGRHAVPALDGAQLVEALPALRAFDGLSAESVLSLPGVGWATAISGSVVLLYGL